MQSLAVGDSGTIQVITKPLQDAKRVGARLLYNHGSVSTWCEHVELISEPGTYYIVNDAIRSLNFHFRKNEVVGMRSNVPEFSFTEPRTFRSMTIVFDAYILGLSSCGFYVVLITDAARGGNGDASLIWKLDAEYQALTGCLGTTSSLCLLRGTTFKRFLLKDLNVIATSV